MPTTLFNTTDDEIRGMHLGMDYIIKPGQMLDVPDNTANHLLNVYAQVGLKSVGRTDDIEKVRESGKKAYEEFKIKQIEKYNQTNLERRNAGLEHQHPTPKVEQFADELGIELIRPYRVEKTEHKEIQKLKSEKIDLEERMLKLERMLNTAGTSGQIKEMTVDKRTKEYRDFKKQESEFKEYLKWKKEQEVVNKETEDNV